MKTFSTNIFSLLIRIVKTLEIKTNIAAICYCFSTQSFLIYFLFLSSLKLPEMIKTTKRKKKNSNLNNRYWNLCKLRAFSAHTRKFPTFSSCFFFFTMKKVYKHFKRKSFQRTLERSWILCAHLYVDEIASKTSSKAEEGKAKKKHREK